ncbi:hypothetical protein PUN4_410084 [Paraburkholderia unamae]|nr:hypothetical protein PUN4_410084 [Paraburkholderia unamae]
MSRRAAYLIVFKETLGRLENGFTVHEKYLASAAYELQTPITLIRGQIELQPGSEGRNCCFARSI